MSTFNRHWKCMGPITLSALSLFISFFALQPLALALDKTFNLLSSRGIGKVAFISMVIYQIILFLIVQPEKFLKKFLDTNVFFFAQKGCIARFWIFFVTFFSLHWFIIFFIYLSGYITYNSSWGVFNSSLILKTLFGLFVVFMLAWTEELIFRGTIFPYFRQFYSTLKSLFITSLIFMIVHSLKNPLSLISTEWRLGIGLFLLGILLNQIFIITQKLYTGMGVHAGLVFVKVIVRRAPFIVFINQSHWSWWVHKDLRQSHLVHILFIITIAYLFYKYPKDLGIKSKT